MNSFFRAASGRIHRALLLSCLPVAVAFSPAGFAENGEGIFKGAPDYTVQIRTMVNMPFKDDTRSSFMGAGFVVDAERGWVMTNAHVAARSPSHVRVRFQRGEYHEASKIYVDPYLDLAILALDESQHEGLEAAKLDCERFPPIGHPVGAFGHPWNLAYTGTRGIVSGVTSRMGTEMLQTDAPINGGNSGGPLISLETGRIVGLSTASIGREEDQNTNFAVPMKYACRVLHLLQAGRDPSPPRLLAMFYEDLDEEGVLTVAQSYLSAGTLALEVGDTIHTVGGVEGRIRNEGQLVHALRGRLDDIELEVLRRGERVTLVGRLEPAARVLDRDGVYAEGLLFAPTNFRDSRELNLARPLMVHSVEDGTLGESLEIEKWDMLVSVDGAPVESLDDLHDRLEGAARGGQAVSLVFKRWSGEDDRVYDYVERSLEIADLSRVGPPRPGQLASRD